MKNYELVILLESAMEDTERKKVLEEIEQKIGDLIKEKDVIGLQTTAYELQGKASKTRARYVSYYLQAEPMQVEEIKKTLLYNKSIIRYMIFAMTSEEKFQHFAEIHQKLEAIMSKWQQKKFGQKMTFFANDDNEEYITWKAIPMLKKYVSRFGDIKARRYTGSAVRQQKKVRKAIIRARELGLLEYIKM